MSIADLGRLANGTKTPGGILPTVRRMFIKPESGLRPFGGMSIDFDNESHRTELSGIYRQNPNEIIVCSEEKIIDREYRLVCWGKDIIDSAQYLPDERQINPDTREITEISSKIMSDITRLSEYFKKIFYGIEPMFVVDVGIVGERPKIIEVNCINSSGVYGYFYKERIEKYITCIGNYADLCFEAVNG